MIAVMKDCRPSTACRPACRPRTALLLWAIAAVLALTAPAVLGLDPAQDPGDYIVARWNTEDGLPHSSIRQIYQTRDGYLWIGTIQGLARFDGLTFTTFSAPGTPGLPNSLITSMAETPDGSLWIGTNNGLARYHDGRFTSYGRADGLKAATINTVCLAADGSLWIGCRGGVTRWADGKFINDIDTSGQDVSVLRHIMRDRHGALWLSAGFDTLRYAQGKFTRFGRAEGLPAAALQMMREDADGRLLAVTQDGLYRLDGDRFTPFEHNASLSSPRATATLVDRAGNLWIGSSGGLDRFSAGKVVAYADRIAGRFSNVDALLEDREGGLWVGTSAGLAHLTDRRGESWLKEQGVLGLQGTAVRQSRDGSVWISSWTGGVARLLNGTVRQYTAGAPLSLDSISTIYEAPDGVMWFGTQASSIDRLDGDKVTTYVYPSGVPTRRPVVSMNVGTDGEFLLGISRRGLLQLRDGQLTPVPEAAELADETVWAIHRTRDGRLLLGTSKGIFQRGPGRAWHQVDLPGLKQNPEVRAMMEDSDGVIWLATAGLGLVQWAPGGARSYGLREGMVDDTLFSIVDDRDGSLWVSSARGMARVRRTELAQLDRGQIVGLNCLALGRLDGLASGSAEGGGNPAAFLLTDGRLLTATVKGFAVVEPRRMPVNRQPPMVVIEGIVADDQAITRTPDGMISVPPGINRIEIRYTALSMIASQRVRFRYRLDGSDPGWIEAGHERSAHYTHLPPGTYAFQVLAGNGDGAWTDRAATTTITLQPRFFQTSWFRLGLIALLGGGLVGLVRLRQNRLRAREQEYVRTNAELDQRVRDRTAELARERARFKFIFDSVPIGITSMVKGRIETRLVNPAHARITGVPIERCQELDAYRQATPPADRLTQDMFHRRLVAGEIDHYAIEKRYVHADGSVHWTVLAVHLYAGGNREEIQEISTLVDITEHKQAELRLEESHRQLLELSRQAGMAEVATDVLHNVGNVLNSVNVSATLVADQVRDSKLSNLPKLGDMLVAQAGDLAEFLTNDPKGRMIPSYLLTLAGELSAERTVIVQELEYLRKNIEHIKEVVAMQQTYARVTGVTETLELAELADDALRMNSGGIVHQGVEVIREFEPVLSVTVARHAVLQILVNLVRNATNACVESGRADRRMTVRISRHGDRVRLAVVDNGVGIAAENLTRIFALGFTTRKEGHGFGLHSSALAAKELGGSLSAQSLGPGLGSTFVLELPCEKILSQP